MSPSPNCYPQPGKAKSRALLEAFARGSGGRVVQTSRLQPGPAAFYGVVGLEALWAAVQDTRQDYYYLDNAYFDGGRGRLFRVGHNALQASGTERPDWARFAALGLGIQPWTKAGRHVLVCPQSDAYLRHVAGWPGGQAGWLDAVRAQLAAATTRPIVVRAWSRDKAGAAGGLGAALQDCWALVTHASAAANEALVAGVPVFCTGPCAARVMGETDLARIDTPARPVGRLEWAAALAGQQWTLDELADGTAWKALHG